MSTGSNLELRYGTVKHDRVRAALKARYDLSYKHMSEQYAQFTRNEERFMGYLPETEHDAARKSKRRDDGVPQYTTLEVPYSYATLLSAHTYWTSVFLSRNPVLQFMARHGEPEQQVQAVEALVDYQVQVGEMLAPMYVLLHDPGKYGFGVAGIYWDEEERVVSQIEERPVTFMGVETGKTKKVKVSRRLKGYHGNRLYNVRPYDFFPDPRVPLARLQDGEFVGRETEAGWNSIVRGRESGKYFNVNVLRKLMLSNQQKNSEEGSSQIDLPATDEDGDTADISDVGFVPLLEMYVELVPSEWELGESDYPEIWQFVLANEEVVISARPAGYNHGKFPFIVLPYEIDGYSLTSRSLMEITEPLNDTISWLFNSHFFNVRASLNNQFIVDPSRVVLKDLTAGGAGKLIRLKEAAYGTDVKSAITQLPVADVTQGNMRDVQIVAEMLQRVSGVTDNLMGLVNAGGRKTATEVRTSSSFGINRLKTTAEWWSAGGWGSMAQMLLQNTQQFYDDDMRFKLTGDLIPKGEEFARITPQDVAGFYDFVPVDGTMPVDRYAQANLWREILMGLRQMPDIQSGYDMGGIFEWMAQLAGLKNIKQFRVQVRPDEEIMQQVQAGNLVPSGGGNGRGRIRGSERDTARVPEPGQISGMGTSG